MAEHSFHRARNGDICCRKCGLNTYYYPNRSYDPICEWDDSSVPLVPRKPKPPELHFWPQTKRQWLSVLYEAWIIKVL